jgi:hypothetical protein
MDRRHPSAGSIITCLVLIALAMPAAYVGGYLCAGNSYHYSASFENPEAVLRIYKYEWEAMLFSPAANIEELLTSVDVIVGGPSGIVK